MSTPVIIDGDTGHGGIMAVRRLVRESIHAGIAGIRIDDQPIEGKRRTQSAGLEVVPLEQAIVRYRAAVDMKNELDPDFVIMAQCYARDAANGGLDDTLHGWPPISTRPASTGCSSNRRIRPRRSSARAQAVTCPLSFMKGKLPRYLSLDEHLALGVTIAWLPSFSHHVIWAALSDFMADFSSARRRRVGGLRRQPQGPPVHHSGAAARWRRARQAARAGRALPVIHGSGKIPPHDRRQAYLIGGQCMARGGYKFFDTDAHVGPYVDVLEPYLSKDDKARLAGWEQYRATSRGGHVSYNKGQRKYQRRLYTEKVDETPAGYMAGFTGVKRQRAISPDVDRSSAARIADMDFEGADVNFMLPSGWFGTFTTGDDVALEMGMYRAFHRWMADYCGAYPERLGGVVLVEFARCGRQRRGDAPRRARALGLGRAGLCALWHTDRSAVARSDLG